MEEEEPQPQICEPPRCPRRPHELALHTQRRVDDYYWLRDREDEEVLQYLRAESRYAESVVGRDVSGSLRRRLFSEMRARWKETDTSLPYQKEDHWYYERSYEGKEFKSYWRRPVAGNENFLDKVGQALATSQELDVPPAEDEQLLLDLNAVATEESLDFVSLGSLVVSPDGKSFAATLDLSKGREVYTIIVCQIADRSVIRRISGAFYSEVAFGSEDVLFALRIDDSLRPYQLLRFAIADAHAEPAVVFDEKDERFWVSNLRRSADKSYVVVETASKTSSEVLFVSTAAPASHWRLLQQRQPSLEYTADHHSSLGWVVLSNAHDATNFKASVVRDPEDSDTGDSPNTDCLGLDRWEDLIPYDHSTFLEHVFVRRSFVAFAARRAGSPTILFLPVNGGCSDMLDLRHLFGRAFPLEDTDVQEGNCFSASLHGDYDSMAFRFSVENGIVPERTFDLAFHSPDLGSDSEIVFRKAEPVLGGYDSHEYFSKKVWAETTVSRCPSTDPSMSLDPSGVVRIPIFVFGKKSLLSRGHNPLLLYGYGSYGISNDPYFSSQRLSLLDRGFLYAFALVRGGGEFGRPWKNAGRLQYKVNTFTDFVACAEFLVGDGWCDPAALAIKGGSAGGMLVAAAMNMRPDLFRTVVANVPFVDCLTTMLDPTIPLTVTEFEEWGNPSESEEVYSQILEYSPVDVVRAGIVYPNVFCSAGLEDPRVQYWEPAKWIARLRAVWSPESRDAGRRAVFRCCFGEGHGGAAARYKKLEEAAFEMSFLLQTFGVHE